MNTHKFIYILIIYICICIKLSKNNIIYHLKTILEKNPTFQSLLSFNSTYTTLELGSPPQKVNFFFSSNHFQINLTDEGCATENLFYKEKSTSFEVPFFISDCAYFLLESELPED